MLSDSGAIMTNRARELIAAVARAGGRSLLRLDDLVFDLRYRVRTSGYIRDDQIDTRFSEAVAHARAYESTRVWTLRAAFRALRKLERDRLPDVFVDLGCGTGRACFFAAGKQTFGAVHGVDFSQSLIDRALVNARRFRGPAVQFECGDAGAYRLPSNSCLIFMFNPFDEVILRRFLDLNAWELRHGKCVVVYANDLQHLVLTEAGFRQVHRNPSRKLLIWEAR